MSPKPNPEQLVKRFSFNRKPIELPITTTTPPPTTTASNEDQTKKNVLNGSSSENSAPKFIKPVRESLVTSTPNSGSSLVRRISAEYNSKLMTEDKPLIVTRPKSFCSSSLPSSQQVTQTIAEVTEESSSTDDPLPEDIENEKGNSFKSSTFVASLLQTDSNKNEHSFKLGTIEKSLDVVPAQFSSSAVIPQRPTTDDSSMKSLFASLEPSECRRIEEEFEKLTNESDVDIPDPDAKLEEIISETITSTPKKKVRVLSRDLSRLTFYFYYRGI